jgi:oxygen-dependent protoporphyrinogen oxidase
VILATPPRVAAALVHETDPVLAELCQRISSVSVVTVALGYRRVDVPHPLNGSGFVVPRVEAGGVSAVSWVSSKWEGRAPEGHVLLRAYCGGACDPRAIDESDDALVSRVQTDLLRLIGIRAEPVMVRVYRWRNATPQMEVGHRGLLDRIEYRLESLPGLTLSASGFRGSGIADCAGDARAQARLAAQRVIAIVGAAHAR